MIAFTDPDAEIIEHNPNFGKETRRVDPLSYELLEEIVSASTLGILVVDASGPTLRIVYASPSYEARCGYSVDELVGSDWLSYAAAKDDSPELVELKRRVTGDEPSHIRLPFLRKNGEVWLGRLRLRPLKSAESDKRYLLVQHDLDGTGHGRAAGPELPKRALGHLRRKPATVDRVDPVTGLMSREHFELLLGRDLAVARRDGRNLGLMLFDVPELDIYRKTFGDNAADSCLRMIGAQIAGTFRRATDLCARIGGATLAVAVLEQTEQQANNLCALVEKKTRSLGLHNPRGKLSRYVFVRSSAVIADPAGDDLECLLHRASRAFEDVESPRTASGSG